MKISKLLTAGALVALAGTAGAETFNFSYVNLTGVRAMHTVTGSFDGTVAADGNRVNGLTNISVFVDGVAFTGNGSLFSGHHDRAYVDGGAFASFDGADNNFVFITVAFADQGNGVDWKNMFYSKSTFQTGYTFVTKPLGQEDAYAVESTNFSDWQLTRAPVTAVPEPETYALLLAGLGLVGAVARRRKAA